ncbi:MAG: IS3 family transposase [Brooklawnia sp.]
MGNRRSYSAEFKAEAVRLVIDTSRPVAQVARELGVVEQTLGNWVNEYRREHAGDEPELSVPERARLRELERENREIRIENEFLKKAGGVLRQGASVSDKFEFIDAEYASNQRTFNPLAASITVMCRLLGVSRSGFYEWRDRSASATARRREELKLIIAKSFEDSKQTYGYRRVHADLAGWGVPASPELVRALMREMGLRPCQPRPWRHCLTAADDQAGVIPDLVGRDFTADRPGVKLVGDITYVATWQGWLYLATVIDCCTREVVGWAMADHYRTPLVTAAIAMAHRNHRIEPDAIFHSDRGSNYTSAEFGRVLADRGMRRSVGRTGICYDNAMAESFFGVLKNELVHRTRYPTRRHARRDIVRYIELYYNTKRRHSALAYKTPRQVREEHQNTLVAA